MLIWSLKLRCECVREGVRECVCVGGLMFEFDSESESEVCVCVRESVCVERLDVECSYGV